MNQNDLLKSLVTIAHARGYEVRWVDQPWHRDPGHDVGRTDGSTEYETNVITVALHPIEGETPLSVLAHELGHVVLGHKDREAFGFFKMLEPLGMPIPDGYIGTPQGEVEAERTAAGVLAHFGIPDPSAEQYDDLWLHNAKVAGQVIDQADMATHIADAVAEIVSAIDDQQ